MIRCLRYIPSKGIHNSFQPFNFSLEGLPATIPAGVEADFPASHVELPKATHLILV
jgi:hypothetical protein